MSITSAETLANQKAALSYYLGRGISKDARSGIISVLTAESLMDPLAVGDGGTSKGLAQWHLTRRDDLNMFAVKYGLDPNALETQLHFVLTEAANSYPIFWAALTSPASTYSDVIEATVNTYEIPADKQGEINRAIPIAKMLMSLDPTPPVPPTLDYAKIAKLVDELLKLLPST